MGDHPLADAVHDAPLALRLLLRRPGFAAVALVTLALGIGGPTAIFSVVHAVLLRPLPYPEPDRVVRFRMESRSPAGHVGFDALPATTALAWGASSATLERMALFNDRALTLTTSEGPFRLTGIAATPNLFELLGVAPALGTSFDPRRPQTAAKSSSATRRGSGTLRATGRSSAGQSRWMARRIKWSASCRPTLGFRRRRRRSGSPST